MYEKPGDGLYRPIQNWVTAYCTIEAAPDVLPCFASRWLVHTHGSMGKSYRVDARNFNDPMISNDHISFPEGSPKNRKLMDKSRFRFSCGRTCGRVSHWDFKPSSCKPLASEMSKCPLSQACGKCQIWQGKCHLRQTISPEISDYRRNAPPIDETWNYAS